MGQSSRGSRHRRFVKLPTEICRGQRAGLLKHSWHHFLILPHKQHLPNNDKFLSYFCLLTCWPGRTPALLQSVPCKYCHIHEVNSVFCCLCPAGTRAISQSPPSKALRMFCQSRLLFSSSAQVCFERSVTWPRSAPSLPPLPSPSSHVDKVAPLWLPWPVGLVALTSLVARGTVQPDHQRRWKPSPGFTFTFFFF